MASHSYHHQHHHPQQQQQFHQQQKALNRSLSPVFTTTASSHLNANKSNDHDCTSIASVGESSSHWSERDDLDNVALVNGSETKDWSTYLRLSNNTSNSSDENEHDQQHTDSSINKNVKVKKSSLKSKKHQHQQQQQLTQSSCGDDDDEENENDEGVSSSDHDTSKKRLDDNELTSSCGDDEDDEDNDEDDNDEDDHIDDDDIYNIKPELRKYYEEQFKTMQVDLNSYITGNVAKSFFEKSGLKAHELSKIWELSDVNHDGVLSLSEFCTAMHLVVLRVRNYELPNELPAKLQPYDLLTNFDEHLINNDNNNSNVNFKHTMLAYNKNGVVNVNSPIAFSGSPQITNSDNKQIIQPKVIRYKNASAATQQQQQKSVDLPISPKYNEISTNTPQVPPPVLFNQAQMESLVEQINVTNLDEIKKFKEFQKQSSEHDDLLERIRLNKENNLRLKKLFADLEREYRNLSDTRIALEIKYDTIMQSQKQHQN